MLGENWEQTKQIPVSNTGWKYFIKVQFKRFIDKLCQPPSISLFFISPLSSTSLADLHSKNICSYRKMGFCFKSTNPTIDTTYILLFLLSCFSFHSTGNHDLPFLFVKCTTYFFTSKVFIFFYFFWTCDCRWSFSAWRMRKKWCFLIVMSCACLSSWDEILTVDFYLDMMKHLRWVNLYYLSLFL